MKKRERSAVCDPPSNPDGGSKGKNERKAIISILG